MLYKEKGRCIEVDSNGMFTFRTLQRATSQLAIVVGLTTASVGGLPGLVDASGGEILDDVEAVEILNPIDEVSEFLNFGKKLKNTQINKERASAAEKEQLRKGI